MGWGNPFRVNSNGAALWKGLVKPLRVKSSPLLSPFASFLNCCIRELPWSEPLLGGGSMGGGGILLLSTRPVPPWH